MEAPFFLLEKQVFYGCLASQHGLGYAGFARLIAQFGSPEAVYAASPIEWKAAWPRLSPAMAASLAQGPRRDLWAGLVEQCTADGITLTAPDWPGYPEPLRALEAPPPLLYLRGSWQPEDARAVALVGTRTPTAYGREAAFSLARDLAAAGYTVVSGLALGIDAAAHAGALSCSDREPAEGSGGRTVAVIGCGLDIPYPLENLGVRARIEADAQGREHGVVISEYPPGTQPMPGNFPRRNRLISALAQAVVVVEAGRTSGALLTAAHARTQGKPLFAVPGPIFSSVSSGTNTLLRKGALLAASAEDIIRVVEGAPHDPARDPVQAVQRKVARTVARKVEKPSAAKNLRPQVPEDPVLRLWGADSVCGLDALAVRAREQGLWPDAPEAQVGARLLDALLRLEMGGKVNRLPGAAYRITGAV